MTLRRNTTSEGELDHSVSLLERTLDLRDLLADAKGDFFFCQMLDVQVFQAELDLLNRKIENCSQRRAA